MKKKLTIIGLCGIAVLLLGAAVVEVAVEAQKSVVSTWSDCAKAYLTMRSELPPLPLPMSAEELLQNAEKGDWSFQTNPYWYIHQPETLYVAADSELAKQVKLPAKIMIMEDLRLGEIIIYSAKNEEKDLWKPEASFKAPVILDETDPDVAALSAEDKNRELSFQLSRRRFIGEITLQPASVLAELLTRSAPVSTKSTAETDGLGGMMMMGMPPPEYTNTLWLSLEQPDGTNTLNVFAPETMSNIEVFACESLLSGFWTRIATNMNPTGPTNPATLVVDDGPITQFFRARTSGDEDGDGLTDGYELYVLGTAADNPDTDGDGYSDGSQWPAGYGGVMRGTDDAFPNDVAAWRDTDGDGLPNEVVGYSTLVEDLDDNGDGTNEMTVAGIWLSADELSGLSTNNLQWENLMQEASFYEEPNISDQENWADVITMAKALVYARTGNESYRTQVIDACRDTIGTETNGSSLALGRNLGGFIIAADLVKLPRSDDMQFRDWLKTMLTNTMSDSRSLTTAHEALADNRGTYAGGSRAAIAAYLQDWGELDRVAQVFKGWVGDRSSYAGFTYEGDLSWQADTNNPVGINPAGTTLEGHSVDGVLPVAQAEGGSFDWPPPQDGYAYETLQGALLQAVILSRTGRDVWNWEDKAIVRACNWMEKEADSPAEDSNSWEPFVVNSLCAAADLAVPTVSEHGENIAPTDWTHAVRPDADHDGLPDGWELRYGLNPNSDQGDDGADGDPDGDSFSNLHEYLSGTDPMSDVSEAEALIFDETTEHVSLDDDYVSLVTNESLAFSGTNSIEFVISNQWHYSATAGVNNDGQDYKFIGADELRFYIRTASGTYTNPLYLQLIYWSGSDDNMDELNIQPYLYDLGGSPSTNITEEYKLVKIPYADMTSHDGTEQFLGVFQEIQLKISAEQATNSFPFPQAFYVDCISMQDTKGLTVEKVEPFDARHLEVTCSDKLDFISARNPSNHVLTSTSGPIAVAHIGLRSWVDGFKGSSADSPIVKHYLDLELAEPMVSGQT